MRTLVALIVTTLCAGALVAPTVAPAAPAGATAAVDKKADKRKRQKAKRKREAKQRAAATRQIEDGRYVGARGDGAAVEKLFCANGRWSSRVDDGIGEGKRWKVSSVTPVKGGFEAIVKGEDGFEIALAKRGAQWQVGISRGAEADLLGDVVRTDAADACAELAAR